MHWLQPQATGSRGTPIGWNQKRRRRAGVRRQRRPHLLVAGRGSSWTCGVHSL